MTVEVVKTYPFLYLIYFLLQSYKKNDYNDYILLNFFDSIIAKNKRDRTSRQGLFYKPI